MSTPKKMKELLGESNVDFVKHIGMKEGSFVRIERDSEGKAVKFHAYAPRQYDVMLGSLKISDVSNDNPFLKADSDSWVPITDSKEIAVCKELLTRKKREGGAITSVPNISPMSDASAQKIVKDLQERRAVGMPTPAEEEEEIEQQEEKRRKSVVFEQLDESPKKKILDPRTISPDEGGAATAPAPDSDAGETKVVSKKKG